MGHFLLAVLRAVDGFDMFSELGAQSTTCHVMAIAGMPPAWWPVHIQVSKATIPVRNLLLATLRDSPAPQSRRSQG